MSSHCAACGRSSLAELCRRCEEAQLRAEAELDRQDAERERRQRKDGAA